MMNSNRASSCFTGRHTLSSRMMDTTSSNYLVSPIVRACRVLKAFRFEGEAVRLHELVTRTGLHKSTVFRVAQTLVAGGLLERVAGDHYRSLVSISLKRNFRLGYAAMSSKSLFANEVSDSLRVAASANGLDLVELDNQLSARVAIRNAERLVRDRLDLAIEFQVHQEVAETVAAKFRDVGIPLIAIHTPHPGAVFFGGNNFRAGRIGGRALGRWASQVWAGKLDCVLLLGHHSAGPITQSRLTGTVVGISDILPQLDPSIAVQLDVKGGYVETIEAVSKFLTRSRARRILVGCINDAVALGALRAFTECGRAQECAIMGQNGTLAARYELRRPGSRLIGSVAFFPETYGAHLVSLAFDILRGKSVPPAVFIKHALLTAQNVNELYPNDMLSKPPATDLLLFGHYH